MGGGTASSDESSSVEQDFQRPIGSLLGSSTIFCRDDLHAKAESRLADGEVEKFRNSLSRDALQFEANKRRMRNIQAEVLNSYDDLRRRTERYEEAKSKILSYTPGLWIGNISGMTSGDYKVPQTTVLLLLGPQGSGKSSLVNKISRVFQNDVFPSERAQVSYNSCAGEGTYFLHEYMMPKGSSSFCLYDTRGLSANSYENTKLIRRWMSKGVRHGEPVVMDSDGSGAKALIKCKGRLSGYCMSKFRMVNFVIFVINGLSVLESMNSEENVKKQYAQSIATTFKNPLLSFRDDKPIVVVTHGDLLTLSDCIQVRLYLGELLNLHPCKQIFDIPEGNDSLTRLTIIDMLHHCLERADSHLPGKRQFIRKMPASSMAIFLSWVVVVLCWLSSVCVSYMASHRDGDNHASSGVNVDWHAIRHLWLD